MIDTTSSSERFSDRVQDYLRYRPRYPEGLVPLIRDEIALEPPWVVADVGSGTGFSAEPFLRHGNRVFGVEPNAAMRGAAEEHLGSAPGFRSVSGTAEATGLEPASVDLVVAGQAFHWFDLERTREEFRRILRPPGWVVLFWNTRRLEGSGFLEGYEALLQRFGTDYQAIRHDHMGSEVLRRFFRGDVRRRTLPHKQIFDYEGLVGRLKSTSYTPPVDHADFPGMMEALRELFDTHQLEGRVTMEYDTEIHLGRVR